MDRSCLCCQVGFLNLTMTSTWFSVRFQNLGMSLPRSGAMPVHTSMMTGFDGLPSGSRVAGAGGEPAMRRRASLQQVQRSMSSCRQYAQTAAALAVARTFQRLLAVRACNDAVGAMMSWVEEG